MRFFSIVAIVLTIFPFIPVDHWSIRIFDFPHLQLTLLTMVAFLTYFLKFELRNRMDYVFVMATLGCFIFQAAKIYSYTAFASYEVLDGDSKRESISIYTANVLQENEDKMCAVRDAKSFDADILLFTETGADWQKLLDANLEPDYPYTVKIALENTYGMMLYSKYELIEANVKYLVEDTIPSIHSKIRLPSHDTIQVFAIHPAPPTPQHNPSSVDRDAEMMRIAKLTQSSVHPVIVMGDFNDVAWSETTTLFQSVSGLLDLRKGRGFFSTYNAKNWIMRWPLDHIFIAPEFRVLDVGLGKKIGSDHFPFFTKLSYEPELRNEQRLPSPTGKELENAFKQIDKEQEGE